MTQLTTKALLLSILIWLPLMIINYYVESLLLATGLIVAVCLITVKSFFSMVNNFKFKKKWLRPLCSFLLLCCLSGISIYPYYLHKLVFYADFALLKQQRQDIISQFRSGKIQPNVPDRINLYYPEKQFVRLSNRPHNAVTLDYKEGTAIRVIFHIAPSFSNRTDNLVYSTDTLFNKRVAFLIKKDPRRHEQLESNWYRTTYRPGLSAFTAIDTAIQ